MRKIYQVLLAMLVVITSSLSLSAQNNFFADVSERSVSLNNAKRVVFPAKFRTLSLNTTAIISFLSSLPQEGTILTNRNATPVLEIPMPDGKMGRFHVWESSIMEPGLSAKFPEIKTFSGQGIDDPYATVRFDFNPYFGFSAQVLTINGNYYIDPYARGNTNNYISYFTSDNHRNPFFTCNTEQENNFNPDPSNVVPVGPCRGTELFAYRLAMACTGEYAAAVCAPSAPTIPATLAAIVTSVNRVTGVYEKEAAVKVVLIANNDQIIFLDGTTDPYANNNGSTMLGQNQTTIDNIIGSANYDVGHVFSTGGGGVATLRSPCNPTLKARGVTGLPNPVGDDFDIDFVAHEMGHQFGGNHPFNGANGNCSGGNRNGPTAYEPGSGTTIMAYAGICGIDDLQPHSDPFFHTVSFDEISAFVSNAGNGCKVSTPTGNTIPVITSMSNNGANIPPGTPFTLTGTATDADGDALTYCWEEWDLGPQGNWNAGNNAPFTAPLFRSRPPKTNGSRTFPDPRIIAANYPTNPPSIMDGLKGETLPTGPRTLKFRFTVRDNKAAGGGVVTGGDGCGTFNGTFQVNVSGSAPFVVTSPNGGESYVGNTTQTVTWNNAATDAAPFNVTNVKISLSTDGGLTFPVVLSASTANDGSEALTIPNSATTTARIKVEALGNIFFDISNQNFTITAAVAGFGFTTPAASTVACPAPSTATATLATTSAGGYVVPITLSATSGVPAGTTVSFGTNPVTPGNSSVVTLNAANTLSAGTYNITVTGVSGTITQTVVVSFVVSAGTAPTVDAAPANASVCTGAAAGFTVSTSGAAVTGYQWQVSTDGGTTWNNIAGATAATYTIAAVTAGQNNNRYRVLVSGQCGTATSASATLTVNAAPAVTTQPQNTTVCAGTNAVFSVTATGAGLTYQWQVSTDGGTVFTDIAAATAAGYTVTAVTAGQNNNRYRVVITGTCAPAVTSAAGILTVGDAANITGQPQAAVVCAGTNAVFSVTATGSSLTYQWQVSTDGGTTFTNIAAATGATYTVTAATAAQNNNQYRVTVFSCTPTGINSSSATLTVNIPVAIGTQPAALTLCEGAAATFTAAATGTAVSYQWQVSTDGGTTWTNISGATAATLNLGASTAAMNANRYRAVVSGTCNPGGVNTSAALLTVNTAVVITTQPSDVGLCVPTTTSTSFTIAATGTAATYQWQLSTDGGTTWNNVAGATTGSLALTGITTAMNGNRYRVQLSGTCTPSLTSAVAVLTVNSVVDITAQPGDVSTCAGSSVSFGVTASGSTITYQWQVSINGGSFVSLNNTAPYGGVTTNTLLVSNTTVGLNGYRYRVLVSGVPCGSRISDTVTLTVNVLPVVVLTAAQFNSITPYTPTVVNATVSPNGTYLYSWELNGSGLPNTTAAVPVTVDDLGAYQVTATDAVTGCGSSSNIVTVSSRQAGGIFIYPNPTAGLFQVRYYNASGQLPRAATLNIYDAKGARVSAAAYTASVNYGRMDVDMSGMAAGVYFVEVMDAGGKRLVSGRIVVQH